MIEVNIENYKITGILGQGGMGAIYYGEDLTLKRPVAIKMMRPELLSNRQVVERFRAEAVTTASFNHPNIATVYRLIQQSNSLFLIMEYVNGWTLSQLLSVYGSIQPQKAISILNSALTAIGYAHKQKVIHRDLKPNNLMLNENGIIKVMDFGIARVLSGPKHTRTGQLVGTPRYMSPEQIRGEEPDIRTDIYSIGIVLYQLLTGRVPFSAESDYQLMKSQIEDPPPPPKKYAAHLSNQLQAIILRALSKSNKDRYTDVQQFADALEKCPESRNVSKKRLEDLVKCLHKKHPVTITPLNQQLVKTLQADIQVSLKSTNNQLDLQSEDNGKSQSIFGMEQKKLLFIRSKRNYLAISFFVLIIGAFVFWLILQNSSKTIKNTPVPGYKEQPSHTISDDGFEPKENNDRQNPPPKQQKENQWIIKR